MYHPHKDEYGQLVPIHDPHEPTGEDTWHDPAKIATFVPGAHPVELKMNHTKFTPHNHAHDEPMQKHSMLKPAAGVIIHNGDGRVVVVSPTNGFGGYKNVFPKGRIDHGDHPAHTAVREAHEESGLRVHLTGHLGDYDRSTTRTRFYTAERLSGSPTHMGWESQAVHLVPVDKLEGFMDSASDKQIARDYVKRYHNERINESVIKKLKII